MATPTISDLLKYEYFETSWHMCITYKRVNEKWKVN